MSEDRYIEVFRELQIDLIDSLSAFYNGVDEDSEIWMDDDRAYRILEICQGDSDGFVSIPLTWWDHFKIEKLSFFNSLLKPPKYRRIYIGNSGQDKFISDKMIAIWKYSA